MTTNPTNPDPVAEALMLLPAWQERLKRLSRDLAKNPHLPSVDLDVQTERERIALDAMRLVRQLVEECQGLRARLKEAETDQADRDRLVRESVIMACQEEVQEAFQRVGARGK